MPDSSSRERAPSRERPRKASDDATATKSHHHIHRPHVRDVLSRVTRSHSYTAGAEPPRQRPQHRTARVLPQSTSIADAVSRQSSRSGSADSVSSETAKRRAVIAEWSEKHKDGFKAPQRSPASSASSSSEDGDRRPRQLPKETAVRDSGILLPRRPPSEWLSPLATPATASLTKRIDALTLSPSFGDGVIGLTGLYNLGNTCFMNSVLQCLSATIPLARFLRDGSYQRSLNRKNPEGSHGLVARAAARLFSIMWRQEHAAVSPVAMRDILLERAPQFQGDDQQDAQEMLTALLDGLHEDLNLAKHHKLTPPSTADAASFDRLSLAARSETAWKRYLTTENSVIVSWFGGQEASRLLCSKCNYTSTSFNSIWSLSLSLPALSKGKTKLSIFDCIDSYLAPETLKGENAWSCPRCRCKQKATKSLSLSRLPPMLVLHLSRVTQEGYLPSKNTTPVSYPLRGLDLSHYTGSPSVYDLYALVDHVGPAGFGHYTSTVRNGRDWSTISDNSVVKTSASEASQHKDTAYLLFYTRR